MHCERRFRNYFYISSFCARFDIRLHRFLYNEIDLQVCLNISAVFCHIKYIMFVLLLAIKWCQPVFPVLVNLLQFMYAVQYSIFNYRYIDVW